MTQGGIMNMDAGIMQYYPPKSKKRQGVYLEMNVLLKRVLPLLMVMVMLFTITPVQAFAMEEEQTEGNSAENVVNTAADSPILRAGNITVADANLGLSWTNASNSKGSATWTASGTTVTGTAKGYTQYVISKKSITTTLTITNNHSESRTLSFDFTLTGGGSVSGLISGTSGSYSGELAAGGSATITLTSPAGTSTNTLTLSGLQLLSSGAVDSTFLAPENGTYTVDGTAITEQTTISKAASEGYALVATPAAGYVFFGWYSEASGAYLSYNASASLKFAADPQLKPVFVQADTALFGVGSNQFFDLTEACAYASAASSKTVVLLNSGIVQGNHVIPAGVTLLIPFNSGHTAYGSSASCTSSCA
jgi:hypothetical protein